MTIQSDQLHHEFDRLLHVQHAHVVLGRRVEFTPDLIKVLLDVRLVLFGRQFLPARENLGRELLGTFLAQCFLSFDLVALLVPRLLRVLLEHDLQVAIIIFLAIARMRICHKEETIVAITVLHLINKLVKLGRIN